MTEQKVSQTLELKCKRKHGHANIMHWHFKQMDATIYIYDFRWLIANGWRKFEYFYVIYIEKANIPLNLNGIWTSF